MMIFPSFWCFSDWFLHISKVPELKIVKILLKLVIIYQNLRTFPYFFKIFSLKSFRIFSETLVDDLHILKSILNALKPFGMKKNFTKLTDKPPKNTKFLSQNFIADFIILLYVDFFLLCLHNFLSAFYYFLQNFNFHTSREEGKMKRQKLFITKQKKTCFFIKYIYVKILRNPKALKKTLQRNLTFNNILWCIVKWRFFGETANVEGGRKQRLK